MKSYDEITASVLQAAELRTIRIKRIRNACTLTAACLTCVIGGAAIMKMEKPTFLPEDPYESQTDSFHSASDPSTDTPTETTEITTPPPTETTTTTVTETTTTPATTQTMPLTTQPSAAVTEIIAVYAQTEPAAIITSIPGETHTTQTTKQTPTSTTRIAETSETAASTSVIATTEIAEETDPVETTETTIEEVIETIATVPTDIIEETTAAETVTEETTLETIPDVTKPANLTDEEWQLLYDMYVRGELPFTFEFLKMPVEETTEETTESLFPFPIS